MHGMKEMVTIRLYEDPRTCQWCDDVLPYRTTEDVQGWDYDRGDRVGLLERKGGFLEGIVDYVEPEIHEDRTGRFKLAVVWLQD